MKLKPKLVDGPDPDDPIVTLDEGKEQCRVDHTGDDAFIAGLVAAAVAHLDGYTGILGRCLVTQTWSIAIDCWPVDRIIRLPFPDAVPTAVVYSDINGVDQTLNPSLYQALIDDLGGLVRLKYPFGFPAVEYDRPDAIRVTFTAGYGDAEDVPANIKHAIKLLIAHWYENREASIVGQSLFVAELPLAVDRLLDPHRCVGI